MKKYLSFILIAIFFVVTILFVGCDSTNDLGMPFSKGQEVTLTAAIGEQRPQMLPGKQRVSRINAGEEIHLTWDKGDKILIKVGDQSAEFTLSDGADTGEGTFTGIMPADGTSFSVQYPTFVPNLTEQQCVINGFGKDLMLMSTKEAGTLDGGFVLSADYALLGLQLTGDGEIGKIVLSRNNAEGKAGDESYTLLCPNVMLSADPTLFYIVVLPGTWEKGFTVEVFASDNSVVIDKFVKTSSITFGTDNAIIMPEKNVDNPPEPCMVVKVNETLSFNMMCVEGGTFIMGAGANEHQVTLSDYTIGQTEVTQELWETVMGTNPSENTTSKQLPVSNISWYDCQEFINKLNQLTGLHFRLPTEAEWEYAARGGQKSKGYIYAGSNEIDEVAWYASNSGNKLHAVAEKLPNELGIYDMTGNAWEWCHDWHAPYPTTHLYNPLGPNVGQPVGRRYLRMFRGGSYNYNESYQPTTFREITGPEADKGTANLGLRLVLSEEVNFKTICINDTLSFHMIYVEDGTFMMGSDAPHAEADERPVHKVTLSDFYIGETEVTQLLWQLIMGTNPSYNKGDFFPVECVSWNECQVFVTKLSELTGMHFRLPTEAEWEYAARGGQKSQGYTYAGSNDIDIVAWNRSNSDNKTHTIGQKLPNELGVYDMTGNVWEWCSDWHASYSDEAQTNPQGSTIGEKRVLRGGCYHYDSANCTNTNRHSYYPPDNGGASTGLRLVLDLHN